MKRLIAVLLTLVLVLSALAACGGSKKADETIKFGAVLAMTGTNAAGHEYPIQAIKMAVKHINEAGGLLGKKVELILEDEMATQQESVTAVQKILARGDIKVLYHGQVSTNTIAVSPLIKEAKLPYFSSGSSANIFKEGNEWIWQARMTDDKTGLLFAKAAVENLGMKKPALIHITDSFGQGLADVIVPALKAYGIEPAGVFSFAVDDIQVGPVVAMALASGCDGIINVGHDQPTSLVMKEVASQGGTSLPRIGSSATTSFNTIDLAGDAAEGWYSCADWSVTVKTDAAVKFTEDFKKEYGREPVFQAAVGYDSYMLFAQAIKAANSTENTKINEQLGKIKGYKGVLTTLTPNEMRSFAESSYLSQNQRRADGTIAAIVVDEVRRP